MTYLILPLCSTPAQDTLLAPNEKAALITDVAIAALLMVVGTLSILQVNGFSLGATGGCVMIEVGAGLIILGGIKLLIKQALYISKQRPIQQAMGELAAAMKKRNEDLDQKLTRMESTQEKLGSILELKNQKITLLFENIALLEKENEVYRQELEERINAALNFRFGGSELDLLALDFSGFKETQQENVLSALNIKSLTWDVFHSHMSDELSRLECTYKNLCPEDEGEIAIGDVKQTLILVKNLEASSTRISGRLVTLLKSGSIELEDLFPSCFESFEEPEDG